MARFLDDDARTAFKRAIEAVEAASAVEVVVAVRRRSGSYHHVNAIVGAAVAFAALATMLFVDEEFSLTSTLVDPFVVGALAAGLVQLVPHLKRYLTPRSQRKRHVVRAAREAFVERGVHNTRARSGVLVYVSWLERQLALVPDSGLAQTWPAAARQRAEAELEAAIAAGGAEVARRIEALAPELARAMPQTGDDLNELPDAIDEGP